MPKVTQSVATRLKTEGQPLSGSRRGGERGCVGELTRCIEVLLGGRGRLRLKLSLATSRWVRGPGPEKDGSCMRS